MHVAKLTLFIWSSAHYRACGGSMSQSGFYIIGSRVFEWVMWTKITNYSGKHRFSIHDLHRGPIFAALAAFPPQCLDASMPRRLPASRHSPPHPLLPGLHPRSPPRPGTPFPALHPSHPRCSFPGNSPEQPRTARERPGNTPKPPGGPLARPHPSEADRPAPHPPHCAFYIYVSKNYAKI